MTTELLVDVDTKGKFYGKQNPSYHTYTDQQGKEQTVLINGNTAKDTDKKFQAFLSGVAAVPQEKKTPTLKQFIDEVYRPGFIEGLAETTIANYELYIRLYIFPFMGHMRMGEITVATIQNFYNWLASASQHGRNKDLNRNSFIRIGGLTSRMFKVAYEMKLIDDTTVRSKSWGSTANTATTTGVPPSVRS